jgi:hypothetical protein
LLTHSLRDHIEVAESLDGGASWVVAPIAVAAPTSPIAPQIAFSAAAGTVYLVWQQRGDPASVIDVNEGWESQRVSGVWSNPEIMPPGGSARAGNWTPTVTADGSVALLSYEQPTQGGPGIFLDGTLVGTASGPDGPIGPLLALLSDGTRVVAWSDGQAWVDEVPK